MRTNNNLVSLKKITVKHWMIICGFTITAIILTVHAVRPFIAEIHYRNSYLYAVEGNLPSAIKALEKAIYFAPWEIQYRLELTKNYELYAGLTKNIDLKITYLNKAIKSFTRMIRLDDQNPWLKNGLAIVFEKLSKLDPQNKVKYETLIEKYVRKAAEVDANNPLFLLNYAYHLHKKGFLDMAIPYYEKVYSYDNRMLETLYNLADIYRLKGNYERSLDYYSKVYEKKPNYQNINLAISGIYLMLDRNQEALKYLEAAYLSDSKNEDILKNLSIIHYQSKNWEKADLYFKKLLEFEGNNEYNTYYIQSIINQGNVNYAIVELLAYIEKYPKDLEARKQHKILKNHLKNSK